jgi:hypothetical protein
MSMAPSCHGSSLAFCPDTGDMLQELIDIMRQSKKDILFDLSKQNRK